MTSRKPLPVVCPWCGGHKRFKSGVVYQVCDACIADLNRRGRAK